MNAKLTALDNGGKWYTATANKPIRAIERQFQRGEVGSILYDRIGGIVEERPRKLRVQIALTTDKLIMRGDEPTWIEQPVDEPEWNVRLALQEAGIELGQPVNDDKD